MRTMLVGNYGVGNLGDEALKNYFLQTFSDVEWTVVSAKPQEGEVPRLPGGFRSFFTTPWWRTVRAYRQADRVVFGGGTLFTDVESPYACFLWSLHVFLARLLGKPVLLAFQGIGPFHTRFGEWLARRSVRAAVFVSVRDVRSLARVASWGMNINVVHSFDPIYSQILQRNSYGTKNVLILIPRENSGETFKNTALEHQRSGQWESVHILSLSPLSSAEMGFCQDLCSSISGSVIVPVESVDTLAEEMSRAAFVVTERFHGAVAALALEVSFAVVSQGRGDKLAEIALIAQQEGGEKLLALVRCGEDALRSALR